MKTEAINVEYLDHMGSDARVCNVARVSFAKWNDESADLSDKDTGLLAYLATGLPASERGDWEKRAKASTHWSPFGHCFLSIRCTAPLFLARQLVKHQIGLCWNEESRRYITDEPTFYIPDVLHYAPENKKQGSSDTLVKHIEGDEGQYIKPANYMIQASEDALHRYETLLKQGVAPEEARMVLPLNTNTHWIWSGSLMSMIRVIHQRGDRHAQRAANEFAEQLRQIVVELFPHSAKAYDILVETIQDESN